MVYKLNLRAATIDFLAEQFRLEGVLSGDSGTAGQDLLEAGVTPPHI